MTSIQLEEVDTFDEDLLPGPRVNKRCVKLREYRWKILTGVVAIAILIGVGVVASRAFSSGEERPVPPPFLPAELRVASYNIRTGIGMDNVYNLSRIAEVIIEMDVDLIGLQEVDNNTQRHPGDDQMALLGSMTGMQYYYAKMRNFQGGGYGVGILSRVPIYETKILRYAKPGSQPTPPEGCGDQGENDYCQGALAVLVHVERGNVWFATTHLGIGPQYNESLQLINFLQDLDGSVFVSGDYNDVPSSRTIQAMNATFSDAWRCGVGNGTTFNSATPFERIDYLFYRPHLATILCIGAEVPVTQASDHRPLLAHFHILPPGAQL